MLLSNNAKKTADNKIPLQLKEIVQQIADNQSKLILSSQKINQVLNIPQAQYSPLGDMGAMRTTNPEKIPEPKKSVSKSLEKTGNPLELAFYDALHYLDKNLQQEQIWTELNQLFESASWKELLKKERLLLERGKDSVFLIPQESKILPQGQIPPRWFEIKAIPSGSLRIQLNSPLSEYVGTIFTIDELTHVLRKQSPRLYQMATQYNYMYRFITGKVIAQQLKNKKLYIKSLQPASFTKTTTIGKRTLNIARTDWEVRTSDEQVITHFYFDIENYQVLWNNKSYQSIQLLRSDWSIFLQNVDPRTKGQRKEDQMRKYLITMLADSAFILQMEQYGLKPAKLPPREDDYYEYYDLLDRTGKKSASFALQKRIGEAYLMDQDDVKIRGIKSFITGANNLINLFEEKPSQSTTETNTKTVPGKIGPSLTQNSAYFLDRSPTKSQVPIIPPNASIPPDTNFNIPKDPDNLKGLEVLLLVGTHDNMADVIMLVVINKNHKTITTISVPRDLYYNRTKINMLYSMYGPEIFMETLSKISGVSIKKYISIDMYAFIEVIDFIGGVDVYLKEDLIDPTYKIKQMGKWETLVMRKGSHSLDGLGALRYSRSRYTSNDFERSERQQVILSQVIEKLYKQLSQPQKLFSFLQVIQKYIETNFNNINIARYWLQYGAYKRKFGNTINTNNILYYTWTNYLGLSPPELAKAREEENFAKGAFILLPKGNDWGLIGNYIMQLQNES